MQDKNEQRNQMLQMISDWQQSGLRQREFCIANKVAYHVFHYWYKVYRSKQKVTDCFVPLSITATANPELITLMGVSGIRLQIAITDQTTDFIKRLLLC